VNLFIASFINSQLSASFHSGAGIQYDHDDDIPRVSLKILKFSVDRDTWLVRSPRLTWGREVREGSSLVRCLEAEEARCVPSLTRHSPMEGGNATAHRHLPRGLMADAQLAPATTSRAAKRDYNLTSMFRLHSSGCTASSL